MDIEQLLMTNNYTRILYFIILIILNLKDNKKTESFIYQYNFNIIMTPENKDQDIFDKEVYKTRTFTFELECNESGKYSMVAVLQAILKMDSLAFNNLRVYDGKLKVQNLYTQF